MLEIKNLRKAYKKTIAVDQVSFQVSSGKVAVLLGPNGAGKSTTIKAIAGLINYDGQIFIENHPAKSLEAKKLFAYVPEMPNLYELLTVREHLDFIRHAYHSSISDEQINAYVERFEMSDKLDKLSSELSKGMMQKTSILCALCIQPKVILLDEPMVGLDPHAIKELKKVILELKEQGATILLSTHMLEMIREIWDVLIIMNRGKVIHEFEKDAQSDSDIENLFFSIIEESTEIKETSDENTF
ncbi:MULTISPECIES: ABC transporter ATP-binding protein [Terrabacteria group]|uniref:ABC transporter ATP-binding protein n=1 Tax=Bacillati TaxID=1783272 RepID=UPI001C6E0F7E|nr:MULTISPECIES: ABC transporter ATP-binding protein [Terrabacteria group]MBW9211825.1 ABC transporter ATP-binding protein [Trueperella sp. zg.1013]